MLTINCKFCDTTVDWDVKDGVITTKCQNCGAETITENPDPKFLVALLLSELKPMPQAQVT